MAKSDPTQKALDEIREFERNEATPEAIATLKKFLKNRSNHVVARAAALTQTWNADELIPDLEAAFHRFLQDPVKTDPGCTAKLPIIAALVAFEHRTPDLYRIGCRHIQMEPSWGPPIDTAPSLRAACGRGLSISHDPDVYREHTLLIMDPEPETRRIAIETLALLASPESELLLRMKILNPDPEPAILADAFQALMTIAPEESLPFIADYLADQDPNTVQAAALALGESKLPEAFPPLRAAWQANPAVVHRRDLLLPFALLKSQEAFQFLLDVVRDERSKLSAEAVEALSLFAADPDRRIAVQTAVADRHSAEVTEAYKISFEPA